MPFAWKGFQEVGGLCISSEFVMNEPMSDRLAAVSIFRASLRNAPSRPGLGIQFEIKGCLQVGMSGDSLSMYTERFENLGPAKKFPLRTIYRHDAE